MDVRRGAPFLLLLAVACIAVAGCGDQDTRDLPPPERIERCVERSQQQDRDAERQLREDRRFDELRRFEASRESPAAARRSCAELERLGSLQDDGANGTDDFVPGLF